MAHILFIDDDEIDRLVLADILTRHGFSYTEMSDGEEAVNYVKHHGAPDLLITDLIMPGKEGIETIREIKELVGDIPVIAVSGVSHADEYLEMASILGADAIYEKPLEEFEFVNKIIELIGSHS